MAPVTPTGTSSAVFDPWLSANHWSDSTLTYSFPTDGSTYNYLSTGAVTPISASQQVAVRQVLDEIAGFTGLSFVEITESAGSEAVLRFAQDVTDDGAYAYLPITLEQGGDAFFGPVTDNPQISNESHLFFTHEIGHTMGLNHGHEYLSFRESGFDSQEFSIMTYTDYVGDPDSLDFDSGPIDWAQTYMQLDIAALQFLYGANYATSGEVWSGDTTYTFDPDTGEMSINGVGQDIPVGNRIFRTIWDGDGDDTYDLSNYASDLEIDLTAGAGSVFSTAQLADLNENSANPIYDARGNVFNALMVDDDVRALIENAIGGTGDDTILGNSADNRLQGNDGIDILIGRFGNDTLLGNAGNDTLYGRRGADTLEGGRGSDILVGNKGADILKGNGGADRLAGGNGNDTLSGKAGNDILIGGSGKDTMTGGAGSDTFWFRAITDSRLGGSTDIIRDFVSGEDRLDLGDLAPGVIALNINGSFTGSGASVITKLVGGDTRVLMDVDGDMVADFRIFLEGTTSVVASDFDL